MFLLSPKCSFKNNNILSSTSINTEFPGDFARKNDKEPSPAPISKTLSLEDISSIETIFSAVVKLTKKFWPSDLLATNL